MTLNVIFYNKFYFKYLYYEKFCCIMKYLSIKAICTCKYVVYVYFLPGVEPQHEDVCASYPYCPSKN